MVEKKEEIQKTFYDKITIDEVIDRLKSDINNGLTKEEIEKRLKIYGYNEVPEKRENPYLKFAKKFWGLTAWMLEVVIILSYMLHKYLDMYIIAALLIFNAIIGFFQEERASKAVDTLKQKLMINARTLRDGKWIMIPAKQLVPGDIVRVRAGDFVPADLKLINGDLDVDQSALTGESLTVSKKKSDMLFSGSIIKSGEANAIVVLTGNQTYFGKTTELVQVAKPKLHAEEVTSEIVKWLLIIVGIALAVAFIVSYFIGIKLIEVIPLALVLLASSIPVALPAMFTISMTIGSLELVKRGVLVTRLSASEDAATMNTLCLDKTGTITMNKLSLTGIIPMEGFDEKQVITYGALASQEANHDPIDLAFISAAQQKAILLDSYKQKSFHPFDPKTRRTEAVIEVGGKTFKVVKGAVNIIAEITGENVEELNAKAMDFAKKGYRTLAVAMGEDDKTLKTIGLIALYDMPRPDAKKFIEELKSLGVAVKMLTGDALPIAQETGRQVGLGEKIINVSEYREKLKEDPEKAAIIAEESDGFAEVYPQDKYSIVKSLQRKKHIVGMTGDGVNDAPSLKQAEVGIAVSSATDVAKGAASVVLTGEGLSNIVDLVKVGRMIYQRLLTWIFNKVVKTFQIVVFVVVAFLITKRFIVSAFDVVLLLFVVDFVTLSISTDNARWSQEPDTWDVSGIVKSSMVLGILVVLESLAILYVGLKYLGIQNDYNLIRTYSFSILFYFGMFSVFVVRERGHFWESMPSRSLLYIVIADILLVALLVTYGIPGLKPIPIADTLVVIGLSAAFSFVVNDFIKFFMLKE
ncbi:plasma-membrane proton-efflux P-type ATPase [Aceticella autotrophica]|uniref:plasma-membrane proton-efflux P-type ATPase n=1 Tax=Aceticella autotrophica TaxID=2755338 RepID=UPI0025429B88|nr:plasma-membrane proton-efflux P-type ATPase [Aceticella autotrophica]